MSIIKKIILIISNILLILLWLISVIIIYFLSDFSYESLSYRIIFTFALIMFPIIAILILNYLKKYYILKVILIFSIIILQPYLLYIFTKIGTSNICMDKIIKEINLPMNNKKIVAYIRNCGATTSFSPQISIIDGNTRRFKIAEGVLIFIASHSDFIDVSLVNTTTLLITYDVKDEDIIKQEKKWENISIEYIKK